ncbi:transferase [Rivularia sp. UHCC 0363]|uniref:transferase n=1 Tax=Rivularia sp. UHCC 0363 TaxID=3110244 RepID=UPI002B21E2AF|nr:transferase [Rivularia sp. UHCC 0363]MEA5598143.1 transferase [Rivularia sp. UHCC 0363]
MSVPPLRLYNNFETFFSGEVIVHASAVIAPGVIMQAAPNSKIIIGPGVCIGMGSILQIDAGTLEIESGANVGAGFLMVGAGKIGANACIGSATTVFRSSVEPGKVVGAGSVIGDNSRSFGDSTEEMNGKVKQPELPVVEAEAEAEEILSDPNPSVSSTYVTPPLTPSPRPYFSPSPISSFSPGKDSTEETVPSDSVESAAEPTNGNSNGVGNHIYGRSNIKSLLITLFPHRQSLNTPVSEDESEE